MNYDWSWSVFLQISTDGVHTYLTSFFIGLGYTLSLAIGAIVFALIFGSVVAIARISGGPVLSGLASLYVEVLRNIPLLVQMFLFYFVLPDLLPDALGMAIKRLPQPWNASLPALFALSLYASGRFSEVLRAGIQALPTGQLQAAKSIGLTASQAYLHVILPQAFRIVLPAMTSEFVSAVKYTSVAYTIGLLELTGQAKSMQDYTFHVFEAFAAAALFYAIINWTIILSMRALERRLALPGMVGSVERLDTEA